MEAIKAFPFRDVPIEKLVNVLSFTEWPSVFVSGNRGTGKTSVTRHVLDCLDIEYSWIDCLETHSAKLFFHSILYGLSRNGKQTVEELLNYCWCSNSEEFIVKLKELLKQKKKNRDKCVIVLDNVESLVTVDANLVTLMSTVNELTSNTCPITCVFISSSPLHSFRQNDAVIRTPITIEFAAYSKDELFSLLRRRVPHGFTQQFYDNYVTLTLSVLFQVTTNFEELQYICETNFAKYVEPIHTSNVKATDSMKLWRNFESHLRVSVDQSAVKALNKNQQWHELPFTGKYLLIAAFLASNNSPKSDKRFFLKSQGKTKNVRRRTVAKKEKVIACPKPFTFERWFHIYKALLELNYEKDCDDIYLKEPTVLLYSQIETLVSLKLVSKIDSTAHGSALSTTNKYRISESITNEFMSEMSKSLNFDLTAHMERLTVK